jgi:hypothetical protein
MPMVALDHNLRVQLKERRNRLYRVDFRIWPNEAGLMIKWMRERPYLAALLAEVEGASIELDSWRNSGGLTYHDVNFPDDERERAKVCLGLLQAGDFTCLRGFGDKFDEMAKGFVEAIVDPLVNYLEDRIEDGNAVLGILERYKRRTEWFHQGELYEQYHADTQRGEARLDGHLREYLVDQGIDFPFSQPRSPSGEVDVVALGGDRPLALEIKLFLPDAGKDRAYLRQGFAQAYRYAADYGLAVGYLVTFNLTDGSLVFSSDHLERWPASITVGERTVFCVVVDANPNRPMASKDRRLARHELDREFLLDGILPS